MEQVEIIDPAVLIRVSRAFRPGMSAQALYEATRGVWRIGPRRDRVRYALAVYQGVVQEIYEIHHWQPAHTDRYMTRTFDGADGTGRFEFVGSVATERVRSRYKGKSVAHYFSRGSQNPITYAGGDLTG